MRNETLVSIIVPVYNSAQYLRKCIDSILAQSYTEFELQNGRGWADSENFYGEITVTNIGKREGAEVIQMYIGTLNSVVERPEYTLQAFQKIFLKP